MTSAVAQKTTASNAVERADVLIVTPLSEEREAVLKQLGRYRRIPWAVGDSRIYYHAALRVAGKGKSARYLQVIVVQPTGMARVKAATLTKDAVRRFNPQLVLLVGIAGGVGSEVALGDVLIADQIVDYELQKLSPKGAKPRDGVFRVGHRLLQTAQQLTGWEKYLKATRPGSGGVKVHFGPIACGDKVIAQERALKPIISRWPKLIGVEMEGSGIAAALEEELPTPEFLMIRGVSDKADAAKGRPEVEVWRSYACDTAAAFTAALLRSESVWASVATPETAMVSAANEPCQPARAIEYEPQALRVAGVSPLESLLVGIVPHSIAEQVRSFLTFYLGTDAHPVPFGGRDAVLERLDSWLLADAPPCCLLTAPAGRGKSALLARWVLRLAARRDVDVVYFPVSARFGTQQASAILRALCGRLALLHGEPLRPDKAELTTSELRDLFIHLLRRAVPGDRQLVVVLDGLDEAAGLDADATLFPTPPERLRIVLSAREGVGGRSEQDYLYQLGWERGRARLEQLLPLDRIEDIESILGSVGLRLDTLPVGKRSLLLQKLLAVGEGDPLLIRFLVEEICERPEPLTNLAAYLQALKPGFKALVERWWQKQKTSNEDVALHQYQRLIDILAAAYGALQSADLQVLLRENASADFPLEKGLTALGRFIVLDSAQCGLVFSHSKLRDYFWDRLDKQAQEEQDRRFIQYGEQVVDELTHGTRKPEAVPRYLLHHLGAHLTRSGRGVARRMGLVSKAWHDAWTATGSEVGFLSDVLRASESAATTNQNAADKGQSLPHLLEELRCALVTATVRGRANRISPELLAALLDTEMWSPAQALSHLRQTEVPHLSSLHGQHLIGSLLTLAPRLNRDLLREAVELTIQYIRRQESDRRPFEALLPRLLEVEPAYLMAVLSNLDSWDRVQLHIQAAKHATLTAKGAHLDEAERACDELGQYPWVQAHGYRELADKDPNRRQDLLPKLLRAVKQLPMIEQRVTHLVEIQKEWPLSEFHAALVEAIALIHGAALSESALSHILFEASALEDSLVESILRAMDGEEEAPKAVYQMYLGGNFSDQHRARLLRWASEAWSESSRRKLIELTLTEITASLWPHRLDRIIAIVLVLGSDADKANALARVNNLPKAITRAYGRALLGLVLPREERLSALRASIALIESEDWQRDCVVGLWPHLTEREKTITYMIILSEAHPAFRSSFATSLAQSDEASEEARQALNELARQADAALQEEKPKWQQLLAQSVALFSDDPIQAREQLASAVQLGEHNEGAFKVAMELEKIFWAACIRGAGAAAHWGLWRHLHRYYENGSFRFSAQFMKHELRGMPADLRAEYIDFGLKLARREHNSRLLLELRSHVGEAESNKLIVEALSYARRLDDVATQVNLCAALANTAETQRQLLTLVRRSVRSPRQRLSLLLSVLQPRAVPELLSEICDDAVHALEQFEQSAPGRIGWTATLADALPPVQRAAHIGRAIELARRFYLDNRDIMAVPSDGLFGPDTSTNRGEQIHSLVDGLPRLAKHLDAEQVQNALEWLPTRPGYRSSRLALALALPEPDKTAHLCLEFKRIYFLGPDEPTRPGALSRLAAYLPPMQRDEAIEAVFLEIEPPADKREHHKGRIGCLQLMAPALQLNHAGRIYEILTSAATDPGEVTSFPTLLAAMSAPLRSELGTRLFAFSYTLAKNDQERLRAHLMAAVDGDQLVSRPSEFDRLRGGSSGLL